MIAGLAGGVLAGCGSGDGSTLVQPASPMPPVPASSAVPDVVLVACDRGVPLWVASQNDGGPWTTATVARDGRYAISFPSGKGGLIVVDTSGGSIRTNVLYMAADEFAGMIQRTDTTRTCTPRSTSVTVAGLRAADLAHIGLGGGTGWSANNGLATRITEVGSLSVSLAAARVQQGTQRADMIILRRDIPFAGPHTVLDFGSSEAIPLDSVPFSVANTGGQSVSLGVALLSPTSGGASVELDGATLAGDGTVQMRRIPGAALRTGDVHYVFARSGFPQPRQVELYTAAAGPITMTLGPALSEPILSSAGSSRPRMRISAQSEYATAVQASYFQPSARFVTVTMSARYLGGAPETWDLVPPDLTGVSGWNPSWALVTAQATWQANGFGGPLGSVSTAALLGRTVRIALQQGTIQIF